MPMVFGDGALKHIERQKAATVMLMQTWAGAMESHAKQRAKWRDRTGHARQALHAGVEQPDDNKVVLSLGHGVEYGIWLEIAHGGKNAIILPTLDVHLVAVKKTLNDLWS
ncbi:MAG: hypothetical protein AB1402_03010 [Bacillota bacterium]